MKDGYHADRKEQCCQQVVRGRWPGRCLVPARFYEDGKWWCHHHAPTHEAQRREASTRKLLAELALSSKRSDARVAASRLVELILEEGPGAPSVLEAIEEVRRARQAVAKCLQEYTHANS